MNNLWQNASTWIATCRDKSKKTLPPGSTATVTVLALFALCFAQMGTPTPAGQSQPRSGENFPEPNPVQPGITLKNGRVIPSDQIRITEDGITYTDGTLIQSIHAEDLSEEQRQQLAIDLREVAVHLRKSLQSAANLISEKDRKIAKLTREITQLQADLKIAQTPEEKTKKPCPFTIPRVLPSSEPTPPPQDDPNSPSLSLELPAKFSLKPLYEQLGIDTRDQGRRGACTIFGILGVIEFHYAQRGTPVELSEQFAAWASGKATGEYKSGYYNPEHVIEGIKKFGVCKETLMPYRDTGVGTPGREAKEDAQTRRSITVTRLSNPETRSKREKEFFSEEEINTLCAMLAEGNPVTINLDWPQHLRLKQNATIGMNRERGRAPGHMVVAVGYERDENWPGGGRLEIRNSWGQDWAEDGYAWVTFDYLRENLRDAFAVKLF